MLSYFYWDPSPTVFDWNLPFLGRPILWYGLLFTLGFFLSYIVLLSLLRHENTKEVKANAKQIADNLTLYAIVGAIVGARFFDVLFYENWHLILKDPFSIFKVWEGGLASHGGVVGILLAFAVFHSRYRLFSWRHLLDLTSIPAGLAACFIRLGNFMNQEIIGRPTQVPWAVIFGHPANLSHPMPRHPVQIYEALFYLGVFVFLWLVRRRAAAWKEGRVCGIFLLLVFGFRFIIEFFKEEQSWWFAAASLTMGQLLSLPLIAIGFFLTLKKK